MTLWMRYNYDESGSIAGISLWYNGVSQSWTNYYFVKNLQGDVLRVYQSNGTLVASYSYDSWGNILTSNGDLKDVNPFRYRGYYYDEESWFYYLQSRYYDPAIGRFINADALASTGQGIIGFNMFAYCNNNPVSYSDSAGTARTYNVNLTDSGDLPLKSKVHICSTQYKYTLENWSSLSVEQQMLLLEEYMCEIANILGVYVNPKITYFYEEPYKSGNIITGYFNPSTDTIHINKHILDNYSDNGYYCLLSAVRHEMYHAYQYAAVYGLYIYGFESAYGQPRSKLLAWYNNMMNYIGPSESSIGYSSQSLEIDAYEFASFG